MREGCLVEGGWGGREDGGSVNRREGGREIENSWKALQQTRPQSYFTVHPHYSSIRFIRFLAVSPCAVTTKIG